MSSEPIVADLYEVYGSEMTFLYVVIFLLLIARGSQQNTIKSKSEPYQAGTAGLNQILVPRTGSGPMTYPKCSLIAMTYGIYKVIMPNIST